MSSPEIPSLNNIEDKYSRFNMAIAKAHNLLESFGDYGSKQSDLEKPIKEILSTFQEALGDPDFIGNEEIASFLSALIEISSVRIPDNDLHKYALEAVGVNLRQINNLISPEADVYTNCQYFYALQSYIFFSSGQDRLTAVHVLETHVPEIEAGLIERNDLNLEYAIFLTDILKFGSEQGKSQAKVVVDKIMKEEESSREAVLANLIGEEDPETRALGEKHLKQILQGFGLDPVIILKCWEASGPELVSVLRSPLETHLPALLKLEKECPGIAKVLYEEYGIANFGRYPKDLLIEQNKQKNNTDLRYGIVLTPYQDKEGVFLNTRHIFNSLKKQLPKNFTIRFIEVDSKFVAVRRMIGFDNKYGSKNKISFSIILGHGEKDSINFGGKDFRHQLRTSDFIKPNSEGLKGFYEPGAPFLLYSCHTGKEGGIGQKISSRFNTELVAPEEDVVLDSITVQEQEGKIKFDAKYDKGKTNVFQKGKLVETH
jgi:hypothetical protein